MDKYILTTVDNTISDTNADVSYTIICSNADSTTQIKFIEVDVQSLASMIKWGDVRAAVTLTSASCIIGPSGDLPAGVIRFTLVPQTNFKACGNKITFSITNLVKMNGVQLPPVADIKFSLKTSTNRLIGTVEDYTFSTILVSAKKPIINSFKINPSITRESTDVLLTYECINTSSCEITDRSGKTVDLQPNIDKTKPFVFTKKVHLGSEGTFPCPPFYLHAKDGNMEAVDHTVAMITIPPNADWKVMDNFSEQVLARIDNEGTENESPKYDMQQNVLLDLVLNERHDMIWAIVQKGTTYADLLPNDLPCLWRSADGITWEPHTYSHKDTETGQIHPKKLTLPPQLVHCPCVHFGDDELYFVGGSKIDIGFCRNTITVLNLRNGGTREITAHPDMKARSLHACVVFPDERGNNNIWVIGGADKNGNGLNDVWRFDATGWKPVPTNNTDFPKRCQFAATVQTDISGTKSLWIGGGAARFNGSTLNDVWMYKNSKWAQVKNGTGTAALSFSDEWLAAASLCYVRTGKNSVVNQANAYRYIVSNGISGEEKKLKCSWIIGKDIGNNYYEWNPIAGIGQPEMPAAFATVRSFALATVGFNGCVWTVAIAYISKNNIEVSSLYYSCPVP